VAELAGEAAPPPPPPPPPVEIIVDNLDANTSQVGTWKVSSGANPYAGESRYNGSSPTSAGTASFRWKPVLEAGTYKVYAWWTYHSNRSSNVPYRVKHGSGTATVTVNQHETALAGKWTLLGTYTFKGDGTEYVEVSSENGQACADAVKLVRE
jgi:hypothetical protein